MIMDDPEFFQELLDIFKVEGTDYVRRISSGLTRLAEKPPEEESRAIIEEIFRDAHSLKGAARAVEISSIEKICQSMESIFQELKKNPQPLQESSFDLLQRATDYLETLLSQPDDPEGLVETLSHEIELIFAEPRDQLPSQPEPKIPGAESKPPQEVPAQKVAPPELPSTQQPEEKADKPPAPPTEAPKPARSGAQQPAAGTESQTIRISGEKLDNLLRQAEEMLSVKLQFYANANQVKRLLGDFQIFRRDLQRRFDLMSATLKKHNLPETLPAHFLELFEDLIRAYANQTQKIGRDLAKLTNQIHHSSHALDLMVENLLKDAKLAIMQPFSTLFDRVPRAVRELERQLNKKVELHLNGGEIEIDKRILDALWEPLIHIIRNAIDHGIETPEIRQKFNKKPKGSLTLSVSHSEGNHVVLTVSDDGAGLHYDKIRKKAVHLKLMTEKEAKEAAEEQLAELLFTSNFSTNEMITNISGRGLGMAIIKDKIESLGGTLQMVSKTGLGTTFKIILPLTLATYRGIFFSAGKHRFAIPSSFVEMVHRFSSQQIKMVDEKPSLLILNEPVPLYSLKEILNIKSPAAGKPPKYRFALILKNGKQKIAFEVDAIEGEDEILVKNLGPQISKLKFYAGTTVTGYGKVVPILNAPDLVKAATQMDSNKLRPEETKAVTKSILIAEDSITTRTLLKNILQSAGFDVEVAVDGMEAYEKLSKQKYDLIISDIEMPRMNGLDLTRKIRAHKNYKDTPVILVTSLNKPEEKELGLEVGANAYLSKQSFQQSGFISVVNQYIG